MKYLYLTFQEDAPLYLGVKRKICGQAAALERLGYTVTYSMWHGDRFSFYGANEGAENIGHGIKMKQFYDIAVRHLEQTPYDILYFRIDRLSAGVLRVCRAARAHGVRHILLEVPNYPYMKDYMRNILYAKGLKSQVITAVKIAAVAADDRLSGLRLKGFAEGAVLFGNHADRFFGIPAVNADNGIDTREIAVVPPRAPEEEITLFGVAGTLWWQGYDRVLHGMKEYRERGGSPRVRFLLVGGDQTEMPRFLGLVKELGLENDVECPGFQTGKALAASYQRADAGLSSLGCYRRGLTRCSSLKAREYAAAGLPFVYAYDDDSLKGAEPFALRIENKETPVNIGAVVDFVRKCRKNPEIMKEERIFAQEQYDWQGIMRRILTAFQIGEG